MKVQRKVLNEYSCAICTVSFLVFILRRSQPGDFQEIDFRSSTVFSSLVSRLVSIGRNFFSDWTGVKKVLWGLLLRHSQRQWQVSKIQSSVKMLASTLSDLVFEDIRGDWVHMWTSICKL